jgi:hypothetical protein
MRSRIVISLFLALSACAPRPQLPAPGTGTILGEVRLVAPKGVKSGPAAKGGYADRRLRDVTFVDYQRPGFAVVYLDGAPSQKGQARLSIRSSRFGARLEPKHAAVGVGGHLVIVNESPEAHVVSCPSAGILRRIGAGEELEIATTRPGAQSAFLVDVPDAGTQIFVAPGPYTAISKRGRFELRDVSPGPGTIRVWHPRFPPAARDVEVAPGRILRVDMEMRVGSVEGATDDVR